MLKKNKQRIIFNYSLLNTLNVYIDILYIISVNKNEIINMYIV